MTARRRLWFFIARWRRLNDLDEEMRIHVDLRAAGWQSLGLQPRAAGAIGSCCG